MTNIEALWNFDLRKGYTDHPRAREGRHMAIKLKSYITTFFGARICDSERIMSHGGLNCLFTGAYRK